MIRKLLDIIITSFFKIFIPIIYVAFILAGIISALVSAFFEYEVFAELYQKNINNEKLYLSIPFLIVVAFEVTKVFLIFLNKQFTESGNTGYLTDKKIFLGLRYALITISVVATLIFSFYNLHNPEYENQKIAENTKIESRYDKLEMNINDSYDKEKANRQQPYIDDNVIQQAEIDKQKTVYFRGSNEFRGEKYDEATKLKEKNLEKIALISNEIEQARRIELNNLSEKLKIEINNSDLELKTSSSAGNKMLSATLQIVNMEAEFPQIQYIILIAFLSILLSIGLELIIWASFTVLAISHGEYFELYLNGKDLKAKHKMMHDDIKSMDGVEADSFEQRTKKWSQSIFKAAKNKASDYRTAIGNIFKNNN